MLLTNNKPELEEVSDWLEFVGWWVVSWSVKNS